MRRPPSEDILAAGAERGEPELRGLLVWAACAPALFLLSLLRARAGWQRPELWGPILLGVGFLLLLYLAVVSRGLMIAVKGQDSFQRLLAGSLSLTFFVYVFVNIGMVVGLLPVVGVPLPLISYGGTSMVSLMAGMGILMSIQTHRRLLAS